MSRDRPLALVTGGARRIGAAIAAALAGAGYDLALHGGHPADPEPLLAAAIAGHGARCDSFVADLSVADQVAGLLPAVVAACGRAPALLVNSASRFGEDRPESATHDALIAHYAVNCVAPVLLARDAAALGATLVVNILDQRIAAPHGDQFSYTLGKLALAEATQILARELAPATRICGVAPGLTLPTPDYDDARMARLAARMPLERLADPADIADAVLYLVRARAVTGQVVFVDGGAHLRRYERDFLYLD